jgi:hypothetical protein
MSSGMAQAIRKVNAITGLDCAEAQQASRGRQLSASGIRASEATDGERDGMPQRNTFGAECRLRSADQRENDTLRMSTDHPFQRLVLTYDR